MPLLQRFFYILLLEDLFQVTEYKLCSPYSSQKEGSADSNVIV